MEGIMDVQQITRDLSHYDNIQFSDAIEFKKKARDNWEKIFTLKSQDDETEWKLPDKDEFCEDNVWKDENLQSLKNSLNLQKGELHKIDIFKWNKHTYSTNPAMLIKNKFQYYAKPEFMSTAFLKMYEILSRYDVLPKNVGNDKFRTMHLCEAPGAFIVALNHFLSNHRIDLKKKWEWTGHSMNPYFEGNSDDKCIDDDRLIFHTVNNWFFGSDTIGDLLERKLLQELQQKFGSSFHLVTADGSIDCQAEPGEQEAITHRLHLAELLGAMAVLKPAGCLVMKMFTFFEANTVTLLYLICCVFNAVTVVKPITSKWANSEVYIVATGFQTSVAGAVLPSLLERFHSDKCYSVHKGHLGEHFLAKVRSCSKFFTHFQETAICYNLKLYEQKVLDIELNRYLKACVLRLFKDNVPYLKIKTNCYLIPNKITLCRIVNPMKGIESWSMSLRQCSKAKKISYLVNQLHLMKDNLAQSVRAFASRCSKGLEKDKVCLENDIVQFQISRHELPNFQLLQGKPFLDIFISRFCPRLALSAYKFSLELFSSVDSNALASRLSAKCKDTLKHLTAKYSSNPKTLCSEAIPSGSCIWLESVLSMLTSRLIQTNGSVCIVNAQMFTRLQIALILFIGSFFEKVELHYARTDICSYICFRNYIAQSPPCVDQLAQAASYIGGSRYGILELYPLQYLVSHHTYESIVNYNYSYCVQNSLGALDILDFEQENTA